MYSLALIVFLVPLYFSHVLSWFGIIFPDVYFQWMNSLFGMNIPLDMSSSFERQKVYLFFFLLWVSTIENLYGFFFWWKHFSWIQKSLYIPLFLLFLIPCISLFFPWILSFPEWLLGGYEKRHGAIFVFSLLFFATLVLIQSPENKRKLISVSIVSASFVALFSILEYTSIWQFLPTTVASWEAGRTIVTLGNPNYLAGYLLIHFPLLLILRRSESILFATLSFLALLTTGSYIALWIFCLSLCFFLFVFLYQKRRLVLLGGAILSLIFVVIFSWKSFPESKKLSFESRFVLMEDISFYMISHPKEFIFGQWPDSIRHHFDISRSEKIESYFPHEMAIDSSHNIFLDIVFQYGILFTGILLFLCLRVSSSIGWWCLFLWMLFFSFNIPVLVHYIVLILALFYKSRN